MTIKQILGTAMIVIIITCTALGVGGVWGLIEGETAWQVFYTLIVLAIGLGAASGMIDVFFKDSTHEKK